VLGMTGFWGTKFINEQCKGADWILALGTRFSEADCSSWEREYTFNFPPTKLIHIDIDPAEIGRNYPVDLGAIADVKQALAVLNRVARKLVPDGVRRPALASEIAAVRAAFIESNSKHAESDAYPMRPERILADVRSAMPRDVLITTDVGWNKNGVGQQFAILEPGPSSRRAVTRRWASALPPRSARSSRGPIASCRAGWRWRIRAEPGAACDGVRDGHRGHLGDHEQLRVRHDRRTGKGALRHDVRHRIRKGWQAVLARLRRHREAYGVDGVKINSAAEFKPALERAIAAKRPSVIDVLMQNEPVPTAGHWNIMDIYSPGKKVSHVTTGGAVHA
jgi:acetolactate synthase-1/2/3 large subunit